MSKKSRFQKALRKSNQFHENFEWVNPPPEVNPDFGVISILRDRTTYAIAMVTACRELTKEELISVSREATAAWSRSSAQTAVH